MSRGQECFWVARAELQPTPSSRPSPPSSPSPSRTRAARLHPAPPRASVRPRVSWRSKIRRGRVERAMRPRPRGTWGQQQSSAPPPRGKTRRTQNRRREEQEHWRGGAGVGAREWRNRTVCQRGEDVRQWLWRRGGGTRGPCRAQMLWLRAVPRWSRCLSLVIV